MPALKYPPNPPAIGLAETIRQRSLLYLLMVVLSAVLMVAAVWLGRRLCGRLGAWNATLAAAAGYLVAVLVVMAVLPSVDEVPGPVRDDAGTIVSRVFRLPTSTSSGCIAGDSVRSCGRRSGWSSV